MSNKMEILGNQKIDKNRKIYECKFCNVLTYKKTDYIKHIDTIKHKRKCLETNNRQISNDIYDCICGKKYTNNSGLWKHKQKCYYITNKPEEINNSQPNEDKVQQLTEIIKTLITENSEIKNLVIVQQQNMMVQQNVVTELIKNGITNTHNTMTNCNNNNKTFNLNVFLNETCKDAMNMSEFINSLQIEYDDFEKVGEIGFVNGISNIIIKNLKELDVTQRPLHCTDKKREVVYVKEDNIWQKEDENYTKTRKLIKKTADKNTRLLPEFKKRYPDCGKSSSKYSDKYDLLIIETMGGSGDNDFEKETKILKNITREVVINKVL
jgi:hypothetical protein